MKRNMIFACVGPGAIPIRRKTGETWELFEVLWDTGMIEADMRADRCSDADHVVYDNDRTKRKFRVYADHVVDEYDAVLFADDDIEPIGCTWSDIFRDFHASGARVAHPALTPDSVHVFPHSLQYAPGEYPFTELIAPILSKSAVEDYRPAFSETSQGWGLEQLWAYRERKACCPVVRLDETPIRHARPLGGRYDHVAAMNDARAFMQRHHIPEPEHMRRP